MEDTTNILPGATAARSEARLLRSLAFILLLLSAGRSDAQQALSGPSAASHRLVGTVEGGVFSGAVLVDPSGEQKFYRLNETLPDGSRLIKLNSNSILIRQADGMAYEVFVFRELRAAIPLSPDPSIAPKTSSRSKKAPTPRHRPRRQLPPTLDEGADVE